MSLQWTGAGWLDINLPTGAIVIKSPMDYGAVGDGSTDDTTAVQACADAIDGAGGGAMWIDKRYKITADITITNKVLILGIGPTLCGFTADSSKTLSVTGDALGWRYSVEGVTFNRVTLSIGETASDFGLGLRIYNCVFNECATGLYIGNNVFMMLVDSCQFVDTNTGLYYDGPAAGPRSGSTMRVENCGFFNSGDTGPLAGATQYGIYMDGNNSENPVDFYISQCHFEDIQKAAVYAYRATRRDFFWMRGSHFERMYASGRDENYCVKNDNAVFWVDGALAWGDAVLFYNIRGVIIVSNLSANPQANKLCKIDAGEVRFDTASSYVPFLPFGPSYNSEFPTAQVVGDNPGTGRLVGFRSPLLARVNGYTRTMTNSDPEGYWKATGGWWLIAQPGDGNDRVIEFTLDVTGIGSDNFLRVQLAGGGYSPYLDAVLPLYTGTGVFRLTWTRGGQMILSGTYSAWSPGATTTVGIYQTTTDTTPITSARYLLFYSLKFGATASTMTVRGLTETIVAPFDAAY